MYSVYIIDNEQFAAIWLKQLFHRPDLGFECIHTFTNAMDASEAILDCSPDLIISDIRMPGMNGLEFMNYLSQKNNTSKIILVSAYSDFTYAQEAIRGGALDYLTKPVSKAAVEKCLLRVKGILDKEQRLMKEDSTLLLPEEELSCCRNNNIIADMKKYVEQRYMQPIRLQDLADYVHLNVSYCSVLFKKSFGISFSRYLINIRMEKAKKLLHSKSLSVCQVGTLVGYPDISYFSKEFKKKFGVSPTEYKSREQ